MESIAGRRVWQCFFILSCGVVVWFLAQFSIKMIPYMQLSSKTNGIVEVFTTQERADEKWAVTANYHYHVKGKEYRKNYEFTAPLFLNQLAAQNHIDKHWKTKEWQVWYVPKHPEKSALQKLFPFKLLFNTFLAAGIVFYFVWLRHYVARVS